jgi:hypothetical protein
MGISSHIEDQSNGRTVKVVAGGALAVAPAHPSQAFNGELATDDVVVNIVPAKAANVFCITGILLTGDKGISTSIDATVSIYVGDSETTAAIDSIGDILVVPVARSSARDITGILVEAPEGKWINAVTSDDNVFVTILGYYILAD